VVLVLVLVALGALPARAHQSSVKYVDVTVDGARASVAFTVSPSDVTEPLGLAEDAQPTLADALAPARIADVAGYVARWLVLSVPAGAPCVAASPEAGPDPDGRFVVVRWDATCSPPGGSVDSLALDLSPFFAVDARHEAIVTVHAPGQHVEPVIVRAAEPRVVVEVGSASAVASIITWIWYGMEHIYGGLDHVCFVLALLLVVVIARDPLGEWSVRTPRAALRSTAVIVTAFTVAHSITLIAASLGYVGVPSRLVESVIAASIAYTALENVLRPDAPWRFALTGLFGLVHGLGFASMLEALLPPEHVVVPLVSFNVGVEIGQLTIVLVAFPVLWGLARLVGAERYRRVVLPVAATPLVVVGLAWLVERM
jgi:hypothetical protein